MNLAYTLGALWDRRQNRQMLDEALTAVEGALSLIEGVSEQAEISADLAREAILAAMGSGVPVPASLASRA